MAKALKATLLLLALALLAAIPAVISANTENSGVTSRITAQQAAPSVSISAGANVQVRLNSPVPVTATFSEPVCGFTLDDISVVNGTADGFSGSYADAVYTFGIVLWQHLSGAPCFWLVSCSKTMIPEAREHLFAASGH